ncbi:3608_t:CDS:2 [Cetraspora pellucida]|uniref:3608_t:CDS:1 n=1 Tax=Cetraspora pellucida TaxID=1433469 RepID=A0ACA9K9K9_9GLOM|nr:3608_t:CDS:2 [Cetraspora pellucida]
MIYFVLDNSVQSTVRANQPARRSCFTHHIRRQWSAKEKLMIIHYLEQSKSVRENENDFELVNNIELIDFTNEETVWVEMEDFDNIYSEETTIENDWLLVS